MRQPCSAANLRSCSTLIVRSTLSSAGCVMKIWGLSARVRAIFASTAERRSLLMLGKRLAQKRARFVEGLRRQPRSRFGFAVQFFAQREMSFPARRGSADVRFFHLISSLSILAKTGAIAAQEGIG